MPYQPTNQQSIVALLHDQAAQRQAALMAHINALQSAVGTVPQALQTYLKYLSRYRTPRLPSARFGSAYNQPGLAGLPPGQTPMVDVAGLADGGLAGGELGIPQLSLGSVAELLGPGVTP